MKAKAEEDRLAAERATIAAKAAKLIAENAAESPSAMEEDASPA